MGEIDKRPIVVLFALVLLSGCLGETNIERSPPTVTEENVLTVSSEEAISGKPTGPFHIVLSLSEDPILNKPIKVSIVVSSKANVSDATVEFTATDGIIIVNGNPIKKGKVSQDENIEMNLVLRVTETGDQVIGAFASRKEVWGMDSNSVALYISATEKSAKVSKTPPPPKAEPKQEEPPEIPYFIKLDIEGAPSLNNEVELEATIASISNIADAEINLFLSDGFELVAGESKWKGNLKGFSKGTPKVTLDDETLKREIGKGRKAMDVIFDAIPEENKVSIKATIKAKKLGDWQIIALPLKERPHKLRCSGIDNLVEEEEGGPWKQYTVGGCLNIRVQESAGTVNEGPLPIIEGPAEESNLTDEELRQRALPMQSGPLPGS